MAAALGGRQAISHPSAAGSSCRGLSTPFQTPRSVCCLASRQKQQKQQKQEQQQPNSSASPEPSTSAPAEPATPVAPVTRDLGKALGSRVVESNVAFTGPENEPDFWEGERFEAFGKALENYFLPGLIALGVVCGGIAAKSYNSDATAFLKPPTGPDAEAGIILALPEDGGVSAPSPIS